MVRKCFWWVLILFWCSFIFYQSSKPAVDSAKESLCVVNALNGLLGFLYGHAVTFFTEGFIRKSAHFIEYMILGILLFKGLDGKRAFRTFICAFVIGVLYSVSDEFHQLFVSGRAMRAFDVMIDTFGILTGLLAIMLLRIRKHRMTQKQAKT